MAFLIDGYNLLHVTDILGEAGPGTDLQRARIALLNFLAASINPRQRAETTIVFDAAGAPPGLPRTIVHDGMTVHFAQRHADADEMIEDLLEEWAAPRELVVVSSDRRVQRAARHAGATYIDSGQWYTELCAQRVQSESHEPIKPIDNITAEEVQHWLKEFDCGPTSQDDAETLFPPGYVDDLDDE